MTDAVAPPIGMLIPLFLSHFHVFISLEILSLRGNFVILDSFYARGDEDIHGCSHVKCIGTLKNCDQLLVSNEDGLPLKVPQLPGTLKIDPFFYYTILYL